MFYLWYTFLVCGNDHFALPSLNSVSKHFLNHNPLASTFFLGDSMRIALKA